MTVAIKWLLMMLAIVIFQGGCTVDKEPQVPNELVIEAFLYRDLPVTDIHLKGLTPVTAPDSLDTSINDAQITIHDGEEEYSLVPSPGDSGFYHFDGVGLTIEEGKTYQLSVISDGKEATAETNVPGIPTGVSLNVTSVEVPEINSALDLLDLDVPQVVASWDNPDGAYFFVTVENIEENPETILPEDVPLPNFRLITTPTQGDDFILRIGQVTQYGLYRIRVFTVNQEYADLYETIEQDSRNLTEPLSNISNGSGIFTAFNYEDVFLNIIKITEE